MTQEGESGGDLHFWVVVLPPKRQIACPTLVEPSTGKITPLPTEEPLPYLHVHALFNHSNYWASTQPRTPLSPETVSYEHASLFFLPVNFHHKLYFLHHHVKSLEIACALCPTYVLFFSPFIFLLRHHCYTVHRLHFSFDAGEIDMNQTMKIMLLVDSHNTKEG